MNDAPQDLTMAGHAKMLARSADALVKELGKLTNPWRSDLDRDRELAWMIAQLADVVADLAGSLQARIGREDDLR